MPPKKQPEIDISTLPQCKTLNIMLLCNGKKDRAQALIDKITNEGQKYISRVKKAMVLDHAKDKGIYVDPQTLTDKQKKDPKFMESVATQLTPQVLGKSVDSYISSLNVKVRVEKKNQLEKPQEQRQAHNRKFDFIYIFDDFPTESSEFPALAEVKQNIDFVLTVEPKISWENAPELPAESDLEGDQQQPEDDEIIEFKKLQDKQKLNEEDIEHQGKTKQHIDFIKNARKKCAIQSEFRNTVIDELTLTIDPYNQENSINQISKIFIEKCNNLLSEFKEFTQWKKQKETKPIVSQPPKQEQKQQQKPEEEQKKQEEVQKVKQVKKIKSSGTKPLQILLNFVKSIEQQAEEKKDLNQEINFDDYNFGEVVDEKVEINNQTENNDYIESNQWGNQSHRQQYEELLNNLRFPGIDRFQIPQIPQKSKDLRKLNRASLGQFLPPTLNFHEFERKLDIITFQESLKEIDEERTYNFNDRIYEEEHDKLSLMRTLYQALLFDESLMGAKYNQNNDKLYLSLIYKNTPRHVQSKNWQCNWKVLPSFQSWIKYFKENDTNLQNTQFYDIDAEKIGHIEDKTIVYSTKHGGVIVSKVATVANETNRFLYALTDNLVFGMKDNFFYSENDKIKIIHKKKEDTTSTYLTFENQTVIQLQSNGDIIIQKPNQETRMITAEGYTIIYGKKGSTILHPDGGISNPPSSYINKDGKGLKDDHFQQVESLKRKKDQSIITKRDDGTVIIDSMKSAKKWVKFAEGTQYLKQGSQLSIEKEEFPFIKIGTNSGLLFYSGIKVEIKKDEQSYGYSIYFDDGSSISCHKSSINVEDSPESLFTCSIKDGSISKGWDQEEIKVYVSGKSQLRRGSKILNPLEDEENYGEDDILPSDHLEPRLFIINNDNTGGQLLSENQLKKRLKDRGINPNKMLYQVKEEGKQIIHFTDTQPTQKQTQQKLLDTGIEVNLDVFSKNKEQKIQDNYHTVQIRSLKKYPPLTPEDREAIVEVMNKNTEWKKKTQKDENQYGHKGKNDPLTVERFESKKQTINFRKKEEKINEATTMKAKAKTLHEQELAKRKYQEQERRKEQQLMKYKNKKRVYESQYRWKEPPYREQDENLSYYNEEPFYSVYFKTVEGQKALKQMPDWVFRPKEKKQKQQLDPEIIEELNGTAQNLNQTKKELKEESDDDRHERYDTVEVNIEPKQQILIKPSVFTQKQIDDERFAFESQKKAYQYHEKKRKEFDLYGQQRKGKVEVPSLMRTQPTSQLNQKYLVTEAPVDKKVKISSMKDRLTNSASNMIEMRKEGPHANLVRTIDKRYEYGNLLQKRTMMVQADLNDKLQRDILINPIQANFGFLKEGSTYQLVISIKNEDVLSQRVMVKKPRSIFVSAHINSMGPIALGMTRKVYVTLNASSQIIGKFDDEFDIVTKHQIYHIPVQAHILTKSQFQANNTMLNKSTYEKKTFQKNKSSLPPIK